LGAVRMASDSTMAVIAAIMNLVAFHALVTVREGTVVSALGAGLVVGFFNKHLMGFEYALLPNRPTEEQQGQGEDSAPAGTLVVTIAREFGSGGHAIGRIVADELGVPFYDSELIAMMAEEGDMDETYVARNDQALRSSALERFYDAYAGSVADEDRSRVRRMFEADERVVRQLAARGSCVIVGRLANWILRDSVPTFDVFVRADERDKARRVARREGISLEQSQRRVEKVDHERSEHCRYCTDTEWGAAENYDIVVNSSVLGVDETAHMLVGMARDMRTQATEGAST
jgi:cytidylate kinase